MIQVVDRPKGTVAYHVNLLVEAGLLRVVRTRRVRAIEERFYGRTARTFYVGALNRPEDKQVVAAINGLAEAAAESAAAQAEHGVQFVQGRFDPLQRLRLALDTAAVHRHLHLGGEPDQGSMLLVLPGMIGQRAGQRPHTGVVKTSYGVHGGLAPPQILRDGRVELE